MIFLMMLKIYQSDLFQKLNIDYFTPDTFNDKTSKVNDICFSLFHMNIRSLNKNNEKLCQFLNTLDHDFHSIIICYLVITFITICH